MVTLQILVLPFLVRVRVAQPSSSGVSVHGDAAVFIIGLWCNGNTADSGPAFPGSSPGSPTFACESLPFGRLFFFVAEQSSPTRMGMPGGRRGRDGRWEVLHSVTHVSGSGWVTHAAALAHACGCVFHRTRLHWPMHAAAFFIGAPGLSWENGDVCSRWAFSCGVPSPFGPAHSRAVAFPRQHVWAGVGDSQGNARGLPDIWKPSCMWCHQESNRGHKDFQSFALPTELWHHALSASGYKGMAKILIPQIIRGQIVVLASWGGEGARNGRAPCLPDERVARP